MPDDFVRRGPGRPRKEETGPHTIYSDGTYSNARSVVVGKPKEPERPKVSLGDLAVFDGPYAGSGYVHEITEKGFWTRPRLDYAPDLSACNFWPWDYANKHLKRNV